MKSLQIKKNLSDADMFKGYKEELSFEHEFSGEEINNSKNSKKVSKKTSNIYLPEEEQEKLEKLLQELRLELFKNNIKDYKWQITKNGYQINIIAKEIKK